MKFLKKTMSMLLAMALVCSLTLEAQAAKPVATATKNALTGKIDITVNTQQPLFQTYNVHEQGGKEYVCDGEKQFLCVLLTVVGVAAIITLTTHDNNNMEDSGS